MNRGFQKMYVGSRLSNKYWVQKNECVKIRSKTLRDMWIKSHKKEPKLTSIPSQMGIKFERHSTNTILTLSKKVAETNILK